MNEFKLIFRYPLKNDEMFEFAFILNVPTLLINIMKTILLERREKLNFFQNCDEEEWFHILVQFHFIFSLRFWLLLSLLLRMALSLTLLQFKIFIDKLALA